MLETKVGSVRAVPEVCLITNRISSSNVFLSNCSVSKWFCKRRKRNRKPRLKGKKGIKFRKRNLKDDYLNAIRMFKNGYGNDSGHS